MNNQEASVEKPKEEKGKRLTKKQSLIILISAIILAIIGRKIESSFLGMIGELTATFALLSLLTKNGLRWK